MYKVLIIEDDFVIAGSIRNALHGWGLEAEYLQEFGHILESFLEYQPHLVLLDISLPFFNGFHWCGEIRKISKVPVIFISSADDNMNIVMAMNMGADDFIVKPFDLNVLVAKVQAMLRRAYSFGGQVNVMEHKGAILNLGDATMLFNEKKVELTKNEYRIMRTLLENKGRTVPRDEIIQRLWESESFIDDNTLTVNMTRLRKKLEEIGLFDFVKTKKGVGYLVED